MNLSDETDLWVTLLAVSTSKAIRDGGLSFSLKSSSQPMPVFQLMCETLLRAQELGLTLLFEVIRGPGGEIQEIIFEKILTSAGVSFLEHPGTKVGISAENRALLKGCLQGTPIVRPGDAARGEEGGARRPRLTNYTVADQLRDATREQLSNSEMSLGASRFLKGTSSD